MTSYRFIGTGVTDSSGVARLTKDPQGQTISGYTGSGVGEVDFVASLDNPIESGSIVSGTYTVWDTLFSDVGIGTGVNDNWFKQSCTVQRLENGTSISGTNYFVATADTTSDWSKLASFTVPFVVEFDLVSYDSSSNRYLRTQVNYNTASQVLLNQNGHYIISITADGSSCTVDGVTKSTYDAQTGQTHNILFASPNLVYKNFKVYKG